MERSEEEQIAWEEAQMAGIGSLSDEDLSNFYDAISYEQAELTQLSELAVSEKAQRIIESESDG